MRTPAAELADRLARNAEAVCRHYLSNGRREGRYWLVGDVHNNPGRSLYVRLHGPSAGKGAAGRWNDTATNERGDLLDMIAAACGLDGIGAAMAEARLFLGVARPAPSPPSPALSGSPDAAERLFRMSKPIAGTLATLYLMARGIMVGRDTSSLRFHPRCWYRRAPGRPDDTRDAWPALIAAVTDLHGAVKAVQRTWLDRVERELDNNEQAQKRSQKDQDGSEIRSVELERLLAEGTTLIERRNVFELMRDQAAELFETHTGSAWRPRAGSMVNHRALTSAMIDSRDFLAAKRRAETEVMLPPGPKVAFAGGYECNDHTAIWAALDRVRSKHTGMVLLHGGSPKGAEKIAACWANARKVPQVAFRPDFTRHKNAAPFKRNDQLLEVLPIGVVVFPGSGISDNLADKAKKLGIPLFDFRKGGGA
jgi:hypothetical protein